MPWLFDMYTGNLLRFVRTWKGWRSKRKTEASYRKLLSFADDNSPPTTYTVHVWSELLLPVAAAAAAWNSTCINIKKKKGKKKNNSHTHLQKRDDLFLLPAVIFH